MSFQDEARGIPIREADKIPGGRAAIDSGWTILWDMRCWIPGSVKEYDRCWRDVLSPRKNARFGRVFLVCRDPKREGAQDGCLGRVFALGTELKRHGL